MRNTENLIPKLYYTITPAFILLDYIWGINVRVAVLDNQPLYKGLYYGFCIFCGIIIYLIPRSSPFVAIIESLIIIILTILGFLLPYAQFFSEALTDVMNADFENINVFNTEYIINIALAGVIATLAFRRGLKEIELNEKQRQISSSEQLE